MQRARQRSFSPSSPWRVSIEVAWITAQEVSSTSGTSLSAAEAGKVVGTTKTVMGYVPQTVYGTVFSGSGGNVSAPPVSSVTAPVSMVQVPIYRISNNTTASTWSRMTAQDATDSRRVITRAQHHRRRRGRLRRRARHCVLCRQNHRAQAGIAGPLHGQLQE
ncbi:hypothetical protein GO496_10725 [Acidovorax citrulli]|nr:hypothetical protein [Paracidovorax citrulli]